jgi:hypothetical protein
MASKRPILVERDAVAEEAVPIKDHAVVMQEIEQGFFIANPTHFVAKSIKFLSLQQTVLAIVRL